MFDFSFIPEILSTAEYSSPAVAPDFLTNTLIDAESIYELFSTNLWS